MDNKLKPYDEYKETDQLWLSKISSNWDMIKTKHLFSERNEKGHPDKVLLVASQNMGVVPKDVYGNRTVEATKDLHLLKLVKEGDFVISLRSFQGGIEYAYYQGIISPAYTVMIPKGAITYGYFKHLAKSKAFIELLQMCVTGIREGQNIDYNKLKHYRLPVPSSYEQDQISKFLDWKLSKINKFIKLKRKQIELLKEQKQVIINEAVSKGICPNVKMKPSGIEWIGDIPEAWKVVRIKHLFDIVNGATPKSDIRRFWNGSITWITPIDLSKTNIYINSSERKITKEGFESCSTKIIPVNNIVLATRAPIGNVRINTVKLCTNQGCKGLIKKTEDSLMYLYYSLVSYEKQLQQLGNGTTFSELSNTKLSAFKIPLPPNNEQLRIVSYINNKSIILDKAIKALGKEVNLISEFRTSLISDVVTGKIDVRNLYVGDVYDEVEIDEFEDNEGCEDVLLDTEE